MEKQLSVSAKLLLLSAGGLAFVAGPILWLFPTQTATYFAWTIKHPLTPIFMGANYLGGLGALWALRMNRWSAVRVQIPGIFVFAITQLFATLLHIPIFNWQHPVAWAWLFVYVTSPIATFYVYRTMEKGYVPATGNGASFPKSYASILRVFAAVSTVFGVGLILWPFIYMAPAPGSAVPWWAWTLTPLNAHVAGGWYLAAAMFQYTLSRQTQVDTTGPSLLGLMLVTGSQLLGALIWKSAFNGSPLFIVLYLLNAISVFSFSLLTFIRNVPSFKTIPSHTS